MSDSSLFPTVCLCWAALSAPVLLAGLKRWDPVGRLGGAGVGPRIPSRQGWFWMELPALLTFPLIYVVSGNPHWVGNLTLALWILHYSNRALIWPWLVQRRDDTIPSATVVAAILFNLANGSLWGWFMAFAAEYDASWAKDPRFVCGAAMVVAGGGLNVWADYRLRSLSRQSGDQPVLPREWPFTVVACPNLLGEIVEWIGFTVMTWSLPSLAFALWVVANLVPRALWRLDWYRAHFSDFPRSRRALVPKVI